MIGENERAQITPELLFWKPNRSLGVILSVTWADIKEKKQRSRKGRQWLGKMNAPKRIAILEAEQKFGGYSFCHLGRYKGREAKKQKRKAMIGENERAQITPELLFWKPNEQKFGGYSFCHLGRYKGREAKKQKRKAMIGENERAQITPELLFWKPNRSLEVILSVTWADIKEEKQRSRKGRQWLGKMNAPK